MCCIYEMSVQNDHDGLHISTSQGCPLKIKNL